MELRACLAAALLAAVALAAHAQPAGGRNPAALRSPDWALFAPGPLHAAPPLPPLPALANLYTIINGRAAAPAPFFNAFHHNLLDLEPHLPKPFTSAKASAQSPLKIYQPAPFPLTFHQLPRASFAEPYTFPTNRPPPAVTTSPSPPSSTAPPEPTSSEEVTAPSATTPTASSTSPPQEPSPPPAGGKRTVLILKPFAKAVAGINGTAVATPVGHAVYHKGQPVDVVFDPRAVAVAGPGGNARAHSDLIVSYIEKE